MNTSRTTSRLVGMLFITAMAAGMARFFTLDPILDASDYLASISASETQVIVGVVAFLVLAVAIPGIAIVMYPILRRQNEPLALAYVAIRLVESALFVVAILSIMILFTLSEEFVEAGTPTLSHYQTSGELLLAGRHYAYEVLWPIAVGLGGVIFYYLLYRSQLVPRWLSVWGLIAAPLFTVSWLSLFGSTISGPLLIPLVVNEVVLAVWLIVKGFNVSVVASKYT